MKKTFFSLILFTLVVSCSNSEVSNIIIENNPIQAQSKNSELKIGDKNIQKPTTKINISKTLNEEKLVESSSKTKNVEKLIIDANKSSNNKIYKNSLENDIEVRAKWTLQLGLFSSAQKYDAVVSKLKRLHEMYPSKVGYSVNVIGGRTFTVELDAPKSIVDDFSDYLNMLF